MHTALTFPTFILRYRINPLGFGNHETNRRSKGLHANGFGLRLQHEDLTQNKTILVSQPEELP